MSLRDYQLTLVAGVPQSLNVPGNWFAVAEAEGVVSIQLDDGKPMKRVVGQGQTADYKRVTLTSDTNQAVTMILGRGHSTDSRASITVTNLNTTVEPANKNTHQPEVVIEAGETKQLCGSSSERKEVRLSIKAEDVGGVYLGDAGVLARQGGYLDVGMVDYIPTEGAIYAHNPNQSSVTVQILELKRI